MRHRSILIGSLALLLAVTGYACGSGGQADPSGGGKRKI